MEIIKVQTQESGYLVNDSISVPAAPGNRHYQAVQEWIAEGNMPEPMDIPDPWIEIRAKRDRKLRNSDWTQLLDSPVNQAQWAEYRQQLRDIPQTYDKPENIIWPIAPNIS